MTTLELINNVAKINQLSASKVEMILNLVFDRIFDELKICKHLTIPGFGTFKLIKKTVKASYRKFSDTETIEKNFVDFIPDEKFIQIINL